MQKTQKGITLIALIITIIVMLILVGVSVNIALGNGLFKAAQSGARNTELEKQKEAKISEGVINIDGKDKNINDYLNEMSGIFKVSENPTWSLNVNGEQYLIDEQTKWEDLLAYENWTKQGTELYYKGKKVMEDVDRHLGRT